MSEVAEKRVNGEVTGEKQAKTGNVPNGATLNVDVAAACNGDSGHDSATSIEDQSPLGAAAVAAKVAQQTAEKAGEKQKGKGSKSKKNKNDKTKADTAGANINDNANATNGSANAEANPNSNSTANANAADEDRVITVNVAMPNSETFAFQVGMLDGVQALYAQLFDKEETCHRTCFALQLNGQTISAVSEFRALEGLTDGATLRSIDEPYSVRDARFHVRHVHSVLRSLELTAAYLGQDGASLSFCNALLNSSSVSTLENKVTRGGAEREREKAVNEFVPPDYMLPGATDLPLLPLHPLLKEGHAPRCLKELGYSRWNPPPAHRRMRGDLLYLFVVVLENRLYHLTASPQGFYVNQSTDDVFNPQPASDHCFAHSLVDTLKQLSPSFKRNFDALLRKRALKSQLERAPTPTQLYSWLSPRIEHTPDSLRAEDAMSLSGATESAEFWWSPQMIRDWHVELQLIKELPESTVQERLIKERLLFKTYTDFSQAAARGVVMARDGLLCSPQLNDAAAAGGDSATASTSAPATRSNTQIWMWNQLLLFTGSDPKDSIRELGGDFAASAVLKNDQTGLRAFQDCAVPGLHTGNTAIVDYCGTRFGAQTIVPGLLDQVIFGSASTQNKPTDTVEAEKKPNDDADTPAQPAAETSAPEAQQEESKPKSDKEKEPIPNIAYGSYDYGRTIRFDEQFHKLLLTAASQLRIKPHLVLNERDEPVEIATSVETKGVRGTDQRCYVGEFARTFPLDLNFLPQPQDPSADASSTGERDDTTLCEAMRKLGFPFEHRHKFAQLRRELLEHFAEFKYRLCVRLFAEKIQNELIERAKASRAASADAAPQTSATTSSPSDVKAEPATDQISQKQSDTTAAPAPAPESIGEQLAQANVSVPLETKAADDKASIDHLVRRNVYGVAQEQPLRGVAQPSTASGTTPTATPTANKTRPPTSTTDTKKKTVADESAEAPAAEATPAVASESEKQKTPEETVAETLTPAQAQTDAAEANTVLMLEKAVSDEMLRQALVEVGSQSTERFVMQFNPDLFAPFVRHAYKEDSELHRDRRLVREAAEFIVLHQFGALVEQLTEQTVIVYDGATLVEALHAFGINVRYLGKFAELLALDARRSYVYAIAACELLVRSAKHVLSAYLADVDTANQSAAIAHFLNCIFAAYATPVATTFEDSSKFGSLVHRAAAGSKRRAKRAAGQKDAPPGSASAASGSQKDASSGAPQPTHRAWTNETPRSLWTKVVDEMNSYYHYVPPTAHDQNVLEFLVTGYGVHRITVLRAFCVATGIQLCLRDYNLESRARQAITPDDVLNVFPVISAVPHPRVAFEMVACVNEGHRLMVAGAFRAAVDYLAQALAFMQVAYGPLHAEIAVCERLLARALFCAAADGDQLNEAIEHQRQAVILAERVFGIDHPFTVTEYATLGWFLVAGNQHANGFKCYVRARYLARLNHAECHPETAILDAQIGAILLTVGDLDGAIKYLKNAVEITRAAPRRTFRTGLLCNLLARAHVSCGDLRSALQLERESYAAYRDVFGAEHERAKQSYERITALTKQAVSFQRRVNELNSRAAASDKRADALTGSELAELAAFGERQPMGLTQAQLRTVLFELNGNVFWISDLSEEELTKYQLQDYEIVTLQPNEASN